MRYGKGSAYASVNLKNIPVDACVYIHEIGVEYVVRFFFSFLWWDAAYICAMSRRIPFLFLLKKGRLGWHSKELCIFAAFDW